MHIIKNIALAGILFVGIAAVVLCTQQCQPSSSPSPIPIPAGPCSQLQHRLRSPCLSRLLSRLFRSLPRSRPPGVVPVSAPSLKSIESRNPVLPTWCASTSTSNPIRPASIGSPVCRPSFSTEAARKSLNGTTSERSKRH